MLKQSLVCLALLVIAALVVVGSMTGLTFAETSSSSSYQFIETDLGGGGIVPSSSPNYKSALSLGDNAVGNSKSDGYQFDSGSQTTANPSLSFSVDSATPLGRFSPTTTSTATSTFSVINYTSYGYIIMITGEPPAYHSHELPAMTTASAPTPGQEEFGINLVKNTVPDNFGADPSHGLFAFGDASTNYDTPNEFRYVSGDTIASAPKSSGKTTYTISYVADVAGLTPGGQYSTNLSLICVGTY